MDNAETDRNASSAPDLDNMEPVSSTVAQESGDDVISGNSTSTNSQPRSSACLEPVARMIIPRPMEVNPFSRPRNFDALKSERERLESFSQPPGWPIPFIRPEDCARAGFFFLQDGDKVQCAFCRGVAGEWEQGDNPMSEHRRHFPRCPFVCGLPVGNIALEQDSNLSSSSPAQGAGIDVCGPYAPAPEQEAPSTFGAKPLNGNDVVTDLGIKTCGNGPAHPSLVTVHSRIKTFTNWPPETGQTPESMAEAGFFYMGRRDHVKCFYCDGGLRNWEASDDPWMQHARWFSNCTYVILNKGDGYVQEVIKSKPPVVSQQQYLNATKNAALSNSNGNTSRRVSEQDIQELIDTPIVQAALELDIELGKVKEALIRKIQQTGHPFLTTEALLEAVLGRDSEYESDSDTDTDENDEEENLSPTARYFPNATSNALISSSTSHNGPESGSSGTSSSSYEYSSSSGDEETPTPSSSSTTSANNLNLKSATRCGSADSGIESVTVSENINGVDEHGESSSKTCNNIFEKDNDLEEEVRKLREQTICKICMDNQVGIVFLPCGHLVSCTRCATAISSCALCRQPIKAVVRTYLS